MLVGGGVWNQFWVYIFLKFKLDIIIVKSPIILLSFTFHLLHAGHFSWPMHISIDINELKVRCRINGKHRKRSYMIFNYVFLLYNIITPKRYRFRS